MKAILVAALMGAVALSGCASDDGPTEDVPQIISKQELEELEELALEQFPRRVEFPGQPLMVDVVDVFTGTLAPGQGFGVEYIDDNGQLKIGGEFIAFDLTDQIPENQPVEVRIKMKTWGNPGQAADADIYVNTPCEQDSFDGHSFDESFNWNIVTKFRVINCVHVPGQPFEIGMEIQNGRNPHPEGMYYEIHYELRYPQGVTVLAPGIPYEVTVPEGATSIILESEPVWGDEHVTSSIVIFDPQDQYFASVAHNDIGTETLRIAVPRSGDYVMFAHHYHGGFWRVEMDAQNPDWQARILQRTDDTVAAVSQPSPAAPGDYGGSGPIDASTPILDVIPYLTVGPAPAFGDTSYKISTSEGDYHVLNEQVAVYSPQGDRVGQVGTESINYAAFAGDGWQWQYRNNGAPVDAGYTVVSYTR